MSEKSPRDTAAEIRALIDGGRADEAIDRARRLLVQAPRYLLGYRLLAEAALERGYARDAITLFRRVLSADPECYISYAGIAAAQGEEDDALWHMERSFELRPDRPEIRDQLRTLRAQRDGRAPGRLRLSDVGRARAELRGGRTREAIRALEGLLAADPERTDLRVALAEANWRAGRRHTAAFHAEQALRELPHCLKASLVLGQFHLHQGESGAAAPFLESALALDPDHAAAEALFGADSPLAARTITISDEAPPEGAPLPEWLADLDLFAEGGGEGPHGGPGGGDWRAALRLATAAALDPGPPSSPSAQTKAMDWQLPEGAHSTGVDGMWVEGLRHATNDALDDQPAPFLDALYRATQRQLTAAGRARSVGGSWVEALRADTALAWAWAEEEAAEAPPTRASTFFTWEFKRPAPPVIVSPPPPDLSWEEALMAEELSLIDPAPLPFAEEEEAPPDALDAAEGFDPDSIDSWEGALAAEMALLERDDSDELARLVEEATGEGDAELGPTWRDLLRINTDLALAFREEEAPEPTLTPSTATVRGPTDEALDEQPEADEHGDEGGSGLVRKLKGVAGGAASLVAGGAGALRDVAGSAAERLQEGAGALRERLSDLHLSPESGDGTSEDDGLDERLSAARAAWEGGDPRTAMRAYHDLFAEEADNERLAEALEAWVAAESAPALVYHLLGDLHRRMGNEGTAAEYYRAAVDRI